MTEKEMIEIKHGSENMCDLLNQEQAELKKAMIEEMKKDMCEEYGTDLCHNECHCDCANDFIAEMLYEKGYRKIPEGAVVLTREEFENINKDYCDRINNLQTYIDNHEEIWKTNTNNSLKRFAERLKKKIYSLWSGRQLGELLCDIDETLREFVE